MTADMTERPYLFIGGSLNENWVNLPPGTTEWVVPDNPKPTKRGPGVYVTTFLEHKRYVRREWNIGGSVTFPVFMWEDWDEADCEQALGEYVKYILCCEAGIDTDRD